MSDRTLTDINVIQTDEKSYRSWFRLRYTDVTQINAQTIPTPLTYNAAPEDIGEVTELYLSKSTDQISPIKTIISGALRNRASDIHLKPTGDGLRV